MSTLPWDILTIIFSFSDWRVADIRAICLVSKIWRKAVLDSLQNLNCLTKKQLVPASYIMLYQLLKSCTGTIFVEGISIRDILEKLPLEKARFLLPTDTKIYIPYKQILKYSSNFDFTLKDMCKNRIRIKPGSVTSNLYRVTPITYFQSKFPLVEYEGPVDASIGKVLEGVKSLKKVILHYWGREKLYLFPTVERYYLKIKQGRDNYAFAYIVFVSDKIQAGRIYPQVKEAYPIPASMSKNLTIPTRTIFPNLDTLAYLENDLKTKVRVTPESKDLTIKIYS